MNTQCSSLFVATFFLQIPFRIDFENASFYMSNSVNYYKTRTKVRNFGFVDQFNHHHLTESPSIEKYDIFTFVCYSHIHWPTFWHGGDFYWWMYGFALISSKMDCSGSFVQFIHTSPFKISLSQSQKIFIHLLLYSSFIAKFNFLWWRYLMDFQSTYIYRFHYKMSWNTKKTKWNEIAIIIAQTRSIHCAEWEIYLFE